MTALTSDALQAVLDCLPQPVLAIDADERIVAANTEVCTLVGQDLRDRNYVTMLRQPAILDAVEATLRDGAPRSARYLSNDGAQDTTYEVSLRALTDRAGPWGVVLSFADVTDMEQAGQMRRDFVANVSHELRTPLTAVMGFIETLQGPARGDAAATERFLGIMQTEAERMNRLVGDLMSLNRVESNERVRPTERVELVGLVQSVCRTLSRLAQEADVTLEEAFEADEVHMVGDADQLTQVFTNLIENAIKYGASGGRVVLRIAASDRDAALRQAGVRVQVVDFGAGIDEVHLPRITERFYRVDSHRSRAQGGTGLGLAIVKHIINRHRGRLRVESELGKGATFTVILPIQSFR